MKNVRAVAKSIQAGQERKTSSCHPVLWILGICLLALPASAQEQNPSYLALGDSLAFGFSPLVVGGAGNFTGYPEEVAGTKQVQHVKNLMNIACPGETSGSFLSNALPDNGCRDYKAYYGLHTVYAGTQLSFAASALRADKQIDLVTINLGGNDLRLLQSSCNYQAPCIIAGIPALLTAYGQNLAAILQSLRLDGGYTGNLVIVTYYSPDYQDPLQTGAIYALNTVATQVAAAFSAQIADGFTAFAQAAAGSNGNACTAGLLIPLPDGTCNIHPSPAGRALLAQTVLNLIGKNKR
ncbi:MAG TPA: SGNH/GDSL hydrolase family protein [Bryobacteraceae bacterium]|nr:SGNH/GDSL hydrolase family protein [Bryobacteraceae bacterium]